MMNLAFITCGLPGPAYHGGAVTCWAILKAMIARGHNVTLISLFDTSDNNPYLDSRELQTKITQSLGAIVKFIEYDGAAASTHAESSISKLGKYFAPAIDSFFVWSKLASQAESLLEETKPDVIFCYHFDALSCIYQTNTAPIVAGVGDLWHLPALFRWQSRPPSFRKFTVDLIQQFLFGKASTTFMTEMLTRCAVKGAFAAHYADWLRQKSGLDDTHYFRTPAHDPVGTEWRQKKRSAKDARASSVPKILMIGDITGTAAKAGLRLLVGEVLPVLEREFGENGFQIHLVGGGTIDEEFHVLHLLPYVKVRGRIVPPDNEFLDSDVLFVPTPITLGIRVRIITGMSYGSCIVTHRANAAGIPEILHGKNALVADTGKGLAEEIISTIKDRNLNDSLCENARSTFEAHFSEATAAVEVVKLMEKL